MHAVALGSQYRTVVFRIECGEFIERNACKFSGQFGIDLFRRHDFGEVGLVGNAFDVKPVAFRVGDDILDCLQLGYIVPRLIRQRQALVVERQSLLAVSFHCTADGPFSGVIGGQRQIPATKHGIELFQVVQRGIGGGRDIFAMIRPPVLLQAEMFACHRHELPDTGGTAARHRLRIEGAFDHRQ